MSINIPTHFAQQYSTNINLLLQQKGSKLRQAVTTGSHSGKAASPVDQIGAVEAQLVTSRFADLIDNADKVRTLIDPQSPYAMNAAWAASRRQRRSRCRNTRAARPRGW